MSVQQINVFTKVGGKTLYIGNIAYHCTQCVNPLYPIPGMKLNLTHAAAWATGVPKSHVQKPEKGEKGIWTYTVFDPRLTGIEKWIEDNLGIITERPDPTDSSPILKYYFKPKRMVKAALFAARLLQII